MTYSTRSVGSPPGTLVRPDLDLEALVGFMRGRRVVVLSGAGCSTESGIPDYRGPEGRLRGRTPMRYQEFMGSPEARARYWVRSMIGWRRFSQARPNDAHMAVARMERAGAVVGVITQNVDGLHQEAGSRTVLDLHGSLSRVLCTACGRMEPREETQRRLEALNREREPAADPDSTRPDGDIELPPDAARAFRVPACLGCGGVLKPDVVFFGENVPRDRLEASWSLFGAADALLVVGSSLEVFSGRRFVVRAADEGRPVAIVNLGATRGDPMADLKVERRLGDLLPHLAAALEMAPR